MVSHIVFNHLAVDYMALKGMESHVTWSNIGYLPVLVRVKGSQKVLYIDTTLWTVN